jgi:hypothetical protein
MSDAWCFATFQKKNGSMKADKKKLAQEGEEQQKQMIITIIREQTDYKHCT